MKRNKILSFLVLFVLTLVISGVYVIGAQAATKPSVSKTKVTLNVGDKYSIQLKNVKSNAKITYKTSKKSVVTVSKGKVTAKGKGSAKVTVKVKQDGKTYSLKVNFTVKGSSGQSLSKRATTHSGEVFVAKGTTVYKNALEAELGLLEMCKSYSEFDIFVKDISYLSAESEYLEKYPTLRKLEFKSIDVYKNACDIRVSARVIENLYPDEIAIDFALVHDDTSRLSGSEKNLYDKVITLAKKLKKSKEYDTVKEIHDYIVKNTMYPSSTAGDIMHKLEGALVNGVSVCDGYAKEFYFLCRACGIDCMIVTGTATNGNGSFPHAWNKVKIGSEWYGVDVTWDDPYPDDPDTLLHDYFLITDKDMVVEHTWDNDGYPKATSDKLGIVYKTYKDIKKFDRSQDGYDYAYDEINKLRKDGKVRSGYSCNVKFIDKSRSKDLYGKIVELCESYKSNYGCGYSVSAVSAGFYGYLYEITVRK